MRKRPPLFIFGSGTSPAPKVQALTELVLNAQMQRGSDGIFRPGATGGRYAQEAGDNPDCIRHYLRSIRNDIASYQGRPEKEVTYEDIADICVQLDKEIGSRRNPALSLYRNDVSSRMRTKFPFFELKRGDLGSLSWAAIDWIIWAIFHEFRRCKEPPKALRAFIDSMVAPTSAATVVTLNHDVYLEKILGRRANLGFGRTQSGTRLFNPDCLALKSGIRVLKLHGSVDWFWHVDSGGYRRLSRFSPFRIDTPPSILAGTVSKLESYSFSLYPWLWSEFQNSLRITRRIIISGYGFKDVGLNVRLLDWLSRFPQARIAIIHPKPADLTAETQRHHIDGIQRFFEREWKIVESWRWSRCTLREKIAFLPAGFEDASSESCTAWLGNFIASGNKL